MTVLHVIAKLLLFPIAIKDRTQIILHQCKGALKMTLGVLRVDPPQIPVVI